MYTPAEKFPTGFEGRRLSFRIFSNSSGVDPASGRRAETEIQIFYRIDEVILGEACFSDVPRPSSPVADHTYRRRFLAALALVLGIGIGVVRWWPPPPSSSPQGPFRARSPDRIQVRQIQPTTQQARERTPPPPAPVPPVVVPNEVVIEEEITFGEGRLDLKAAGEDQQLRDGSPEAAPAAQPDTDARLFRAVQPNYPETAREQSIRARIQVSVQVSKTGRVEHATVLKRWRLLDEGRARPVGDLEHGLEQAALVAARRSRFRPARHNGSPVATQTTLTFEFGTGEN